MSHQVYSNHQFKIYQTSKGEFIVHNSNKPFESGHTHVRNFNTAKYLTSMAYHKRVPKHLSDYLMVSLIRISSSREYKNKLYVKLKRS